jgi:hypothetical protein
MEKTVIPFLAAEALVDEADLESVLLNALSLFASFCSREFSSPSIRISVNDFFLE